MKKIDDEILMAYVDSELGEEERKDVELFLANNPQARRKVDEFRETRAAIYHFADILDEPVPAHLIGTIRDNTAPSNVVKISGRQGSGRSWFAIAASLVVGISLGTIATYQVLDQSHKGETRLAEAKIEGLAQALELAQAERKKIEEKVAASSATNEIENIFPSMLVADAIENGSRLPTNARKNILAELNKNSLTTNASQYESLSDLQPTDPEEAKSQGQVEARDTVLATTSMGNILGEFSYAGQTCRILKYGSQQTPILACSKEGEEWTIIQKGN